MRVPAIVPRNGRSRADARERPAFTQRGGAVLLLPSLLDGGDHHDKLTRIAYELSAELDRPDLVEAVPSTRTEEPTPQLQRKRRGRDPPQIGRPSYVENVSAVLHRHGSPAIGGLSGGGPWSRGPPFPPPIFFFPPQGGLAQR